MFASVFTSCASVSLALLELLALWTLLDEAGFFTCEAVGPTPENLPQSPVSLSIASTGSEGCAPYSTSIVRVRS